ncbi:RNA-binding protein PNO1 [Pancytospora epiphaga]|nr:RNA-binding protein PNO1 [Pancytospora epiphaga]
MGADCIVQERSVEVPPYRIRQLKQDWTKVYTAIVEYGRLQLRFNRATRTVDLRTCDTTPDQSYIERGVSFLQALFYGFRVEDAAALMKYRDVFIETFEIGDIRKLKRAHMSRAIGRVIGREGRTKSSIENFSKCKFILNDQRIVVIGCPENIKMAKDGIGRLVQGCEPSSIFNRMRMTSLKLKEKYGSIQSIYEDLRQA